MFMVNPFVLFMFAVNTDGPINRPTILKRDGRSTVSPAKKARLSQTLNTDSPIAENERHVALLSARKQRLDTVRQNTFSALNVIAEREAEHSTSSLQVLDIENGEENQPLEVTNTTQGSTRSPEEGRTNPTKPIEASNSAAQPKSSSLETGM